VLRDAATSSPLRFTSTDATRSAARILDLDFPALTEESDFTADNAGRADPRYAIFLQHIRHAYRFVRDQRGEPEEIQHNQHVVPEAVLFLLAVNVFPCAHDPRPKPPRTPRLIGATRICPLPGRLFLYVPGPLVANRTLTRNPDSDLPVQLESLTTKFYHWHQLYRQIYASPSWTRTLRDLPWIHIFDDHEVINDYHPGIANGDVSKPCLRADPVTGKIFILTP
jgi:hypothetical protein